MYENIKRWYNSGIWTEKMVLQAYAKGKLTKAECTDILGYEPEE